MTTSNVNVPPPPPPAPSPWPAQPSRQETDRQHLKLLRVFHFVLGGISAFVGCFFIIHLVMGIVMLTSPQIFQGGQGGPPPAFVGWLVVGLGGGAICFFWLAAAILLTAGAFLRRPAHYKFCFAAAVVACLLMPLGTVLGVFTIIVLLRPGVKALFGTGQL